MECKFKQISHFDTACSLPVRSSQSVVNEAINRLLGNVGQHAYNKTAMEKSKTFLKNKIVSFEQDSVKQVYQPRPIIPYLSKEEQSPKNGVADCMRPMSAQIRHVSRNQKRSSLNIESRKTILSHMVSLKGIPRSNKNVLAIKSFMEGTKSSKRKFNTKSNNNQERFLAVMSAMEQDDSNADFIEELRLKKKQEQNEVKKKQQFLKSIQLESTTYSVAQSKFIQFISRKKFIYGHHGEVIEINGTSQKLHLKKISAMSKSRVEIKSKMIEDQKMFQDELKENIYIEFKGRQLYQSRPETSKPNVNQKTQQSQDHNQTSKKLSTRQTKNQKQPTKTPQNIEGTKSGQKTPYNRQTRGSTEADKGIVNKKIEKKLFYPSANSVYRVVNDGSTAQVNHAVTVEDI